MKNKEVELRKHSIYLVSNAKKGFDYEYLVFVDPNDEKDRSPFLKELFNIIKNGQKNRSFADQNHLKELKKWIGAKNDKDPDLTPYNWLKTSIERYPYKLFVATNENLEYLPEFIKKRICFIKKEYIKEYINKEDKEEIKLFLSIRWLEHVLININNKKLGNSWSIEFYIGEGTERSEPYFPETVPDNLKSISIQNNNVLIKKDDNGMKIEGKNKPDKPEKGIKYIYLNRHKAFYKIKKEGCKYKLSTDLEDFKNKLIYSEALSGNLSYLNQIAFSLETLDKLNSKIFFVKFAESSLIRLGICDERFQEWWLKREINVSINLAQQLLWPAYLIEQDCYGQKEYPKAGMWFVIDYKDNKFNTRRKRRKLAKIDINNIEIWKNEGLDCLIIHQGILDGFIKEHAVSSTRFMLRLKEIIPFLVITSGRGRPDKLPYGVKFLPFSNIDYCIKGNYFEKLSIIKTINSITENI